MNSTAFLLTGTVMMLENYNRVVKTIESLHALRDEKFKKRSIESFPKNIDEYIEKSLVEDVVIIATEADMDSLKKFMITVSHQFKFTNHTFYLYLIVEKRIDISTLGSLGFTRIDLYSLRTQGII